MVQQSCRMMQKLQDEHGSFCWTPCGVPASCQCAGGLLQVLVAGHYLHSAGACVAAAHSTSGSSDCQQSLLLHRTAVCHTLLHCLLSPAPPAVNNMCRTRCRHASAAALCWPRLATTNQSHIKYDKTEKRPAKACWLVQSPERWEWPAGQLQLAQQHHQLWP